MSLGDGASAASALRSLVSEAFSRGLRPLPTCTVPAEAMPGDEGPPVEEPPCDKTSPTTIGGTSEGIASMTRGESGHMPCVFQDEYGFDLLDSLYKSEMLSMVDPKYLTAQPEFNAGKRATMIDWMAHVHRGFDCTSPSLFLAVNLLDRLLSTSRAKNDTHLKLLAMVALLIATKFEEVRALTVDIVVSLSQDAFTKDDLRRMECRCLASIGFEVTTPTSYNFFAIFQSANGCDCQHLQLATYILELSLADATMLRHEPSGVAAAALLLSNQLVGRSTSWPSAMARATRHAEAALADIADRLRELLVMAPESALRKVTEKYSTVEHYRVATRFSDVDRR